MRYLQPLLLAAIVAAGCKGPPTSAAVERRDVKGYLVLEGELVTPPTDFAEVLSPFRAPVEKVFVTEGAWVGEGEVIVQLSIPNASAMLVQAQNNLKSAESALAQARQAHGARISALQAQLATLRQRQSQGEDVSIEFAAVQGQLNFAQSDLERELSPLRYNVESARINLQEAQSGAKLGSIRAPISGTVLEVHARAGEMAGEDRDRPVATICDLAGLVVHAPIPKERTGDIEPGDAAKLSFEGSSEDFEGRVSRIVTRVERGEVEYVAVLSFSNRSGQIKPGTKVTGVAIETGEAQGVLAVPSDAVDSDTTGRPIVNVLRDGKWLPTIVETGLSGGGWTEIKSGLEAGETVQVTP